MMSVAQLQQHSSGGDVGGPEKSTAPITSNVALSLRFFLVDYYRWDHTAVVVDVEVL